MQVFRPFPSDSKRSTAQPDKDKPQGVSAGEHYLPRSKSAASDVS